MNIQAILFFALVALAAPPCCRPKSAGTQAPEVGADSKSRMKSERRDSEASMASPSISRSNAVGETLKDAESQPRSFEALNKNLETALAKIPPPRSLKEYVALRLPFREMLDVRRDLLFSIPVSRNADRDRIDAWKKLELIGNSGYFDNEQRIYCENLMNKYLDASRIEKLVIWELIRCRMDYWQANGGGRGGLGEIGASEQRLKDEMAKLLFSALEIDASGLFRSVELKRKLSDDALERQRASEAEDEIAALYKKQSKVAEKILEEHWKQPQ